MKQRLLVAALGVPALLLILLAAPVWATGALCALLSAVGCYELMHAVGGAGWKSLIVMPAFAAALTLELGLEIIEPGVWLPGIVFLAVVYVFVTAILTHGKRGQVGFAAMMAGLFGAFALAAGFACIVRLRGASPVLALTPFVGAFMSDTGAFFAGRAFGKRKLAPNVSPNKTVAGCIGGFLGSVVGMVVLGLVARWTVRMDLGWGFLVLMGLAGSLMGQIGDLSFSVIKREFGIKDYGKIFLTHGGVLDRFDSVLFVAPAYWLLLSLWF